MTDLKLNERILEGDREALEHIARALEGSALPGSASVADSRPSPAQSPREGQALPGNDHRANGQKHVAPSPAIEPPTNEPPAIEPPVIDPPATQPLALAPSGIEILLEAMPAAIGILKGDRLITANCAFAYAFGYRSATHLIEAGGLEAILSRGLAGLHLDGPDGVTENVDVLSRSRRRLNVAFALTTLDARAELRLLRLIDGAELAEENLNTPGEDDPHGIQRHDVEDQQDTDEAPFTTEETPKTDATSAPASERDMAARQSEFLAKVSHEVRTPLNSIIGFAELMLHERFGPIGNTRYKGYADDIHQSGLYALSLLNDLLDISKIEAGKFEVDFTAVDVAEVVELCVSSLQPLAKRTRIVLRSSFADDLPLVVTDPRRLRQVMLNLLTNAIKFTDEGGQVIVSGSVLDGALRLRVHDSGVGMSKNDIAYAMQPFHQLDTSPRHQSGTGLGLPLTKALADAIRARLELSSEPGIGTSADIIFAPDRLFES